MLQNLKEHVLLAPDVVVKARLGHSDRLRDVTNGCPAVALPHHELRCRAEDLFVARLSLRRRHGFCCVSGYPHSEKFIYFGSVGRRSIYTDCLLSVRQATDRSVERSSANFTTWQMIPRKPRISSRRTPPTLAKLRNSTTLGWTKWPHPPMATPDAGATSPVVRNRKQRSAPSERPHAPISVGDGKPGVRH